MENLVIIKDNKAVTDSLTVAEVFGKEHKRVLQDIRELGCSDNFRQHNFVLSSYVNSQNKTMPMYYMNRKGFTFLVMGYTGSKADEFKEAYIEQFEEMEETLKNQPRVLSDREQLMASMKLSLELAEEFSTVKEDVNHLKRVVDNELTLNHGQQQVLHHEIKKRVETLYSDYEEDITKQGMYAQIHKHLRRAFLTPKYIFVKRKDFDEAVAWVKAWRPIF